MTEKPNENSEVEVAVLIKRAFMAGWKAADDWYANENISEEDSYTNWLNNNGQ